MARPRARILDRWLFRETLETWAGVSGVLLLILMASRFAFYLGDAASGRLPGSAVFTLLGLSVVSYLTLIIPLGLFLGVMLAFGRLYRDSEMAALMACGVGIRDLYRPLFRLGGLLAVLLLVLSLFVAPWAAEKSFLVRKHAEREAEVALFESGKFKSTRDGSAVYYAEKVDQATLALDNVFVQRVEQVPPRAGAPEGTPSTERISVITAKSGRQETDEKTGTRRLVLRDGRRYTGVPGETGFAVIEFAEHGVVLDVADPNFVSEDRRLRSTRDLIDEGDARAIAELNSRIGTPLTALIFVLLALPLSRANPREGRFARLFAAILVWIIYNNLLNSAMVWMNREVLPAGVGLWPIHLLFVLLAFALLIRQNGWRTLFDDLAGHRLPRTAAA